MAFDPITGAGVPEDSVTGQPAIPLYTDRAAHSSEQGIIGGGRNESDQTNNYTVTKEECNGTVLDGTGAVAVSSGAPAYLMGVLIITSGTTVAITGLLDQLGAAKTVTLTSSAASQFWAFPAIRCNTAIGATASVDDDVVIFWRPI